jgi:hypothetical protein
MLAYEQHVQYGGLTFRVHTEHWTEGSTQQIVSELFFKRSLVDIRRHSYALERGPTGGLRLLRLVGRHHRRLVTELGRGELDAKISATPGTGEFKAVDLGEPTSAPALAPVSASSGGVDNIVRNLLEPAASDGLDALSPRSGDDRVIAAHAQCGAVEPAVRAIGDADATSAVTEFDEPGPTAVGLTSLAGGDALSGPAVTFAGDLSLLGVPELLEFLQLGRRTGILVIVGDRGMGQVHLRGGMITGGASPSCDRINELLLRTGAISRVQSDAIRARIGGDATDGAFVAALAEEGIANRVQLREAYLERLFSVLFDLAQWREGQFAFDPCGPGGLPEAAVEVEVDTQAALLEALRRVDEARRE